jgi:1,2-phenylacetyl-CoA epoxidase catalytic subunit
MHVTTWAERLAGAGGEARTRFVAAVEALAPDAAAVLAPPEDEAALLEAGVLARSLRDAEADWRREVGTLLGRLGIRLAIPPARGERGRAGSEPSPDFRWLWGEFTSVRRSAPGASW